MARAMTHMTEQQAHAIVDKLKAEGFTSGIDCAAVCLDGYYSQRSRRWGEPKSDRWGVSLTTLGEMRAAAQRALGTEFADVGRGSDQHYWIFEWRPQFEAVPPVSDPLAKVNAHERGIGAMTGLLETLVVDADINENTSCEEAARQLIEAYNAASAESSGADA